MFSKSVRSSWRKSFSIFRWSNAKTFIRESFKTAINAILTPTFWGLAALSFLLAILLYLVIGGMYSRVIGVFSVEPFAFVFVIVGYIWGLYLSFIFLLTLRPVTMKKKLSYYEKYFPQFGRYFVLTLLTTMFISCGFFILIVAYVFPVLLFLLSRAAVPAIQGFLVITGITLIILITILLFLFSCFSGLIHFFSTLFMLDAPRRKSIWEIFKKGVEASWRNAPFSFYLNACKSELMIFTW